MGSSSSSEPWQGYEFQLLSDDGKTREKRQSVDVGFEEKGATKIMRHPKSEQAFRMFLKDKGGVDISTGWKAVNDAFKAYPDHALFGYRPFVNAEQDPSLRGDYQWDSYRTIQKQTYGVANGLRALGLAPNSNLGIFSMNRSEWLISCMAIWSHSHRTVALYDTLGAQAVQYILHHGELALIFVERNKLPQLFEAIRSCPDDKQLKIKHIVQFDVQDRYKNLHETVAPSDLQTAQGFGIKLIGFTELLQHGDGEPTDSVPEAKNLAYIMYTSGTTGDPKGVMQSHGALACAVASVYRSWDSHAEPINSSDRHVSYLPLAHSFESCVQLNCIFGGARVAFFAGNLKTISQDWQDVQPTLMFGVPRIFNKTHDKVHLKIASAGWLKQWLFAKALAASSAAIKRNERSAWYDSLIWDKVVATIGFAQVRILISGAAPLPPHVAEFLRIVCKNAVIGQGYGLTETCAASFITGYDDVNLGHVGAPMDNIEFRLVDAPECEYSVLDKPYARGEVEMRGPTVMDGYFKNEEATHKCLSAEGWFSTGDIGRLNPNGTLSIIDRRKNMFKTAMGEYIAAEKVENQYSKALAVGQLWIYGNSFKSFVVGVVVPDPLWLVPKLKVKGLWKDEGLTPATPPYCRKFAEIVGANETFIKQVIAANIKEVEQASDLKKFELMKDFHLEYELDELFQGFNVNNNCMTPTFKKKRPQLLKKYKEQIQQMYATHGEPANQDEHW